MFIHLRADLSTISIGESDFCNPPAPSRNCTWEVIALRNKGHDGLGNKALNSHTDLISNVHERTRWCEDGRV